MAARLGYLDHAREKRSARLAAVVFPTARIQPLREPDPAQRQRRQEAALICQAGVRRRNLGPMAMSESGAGPAPMLCREAKDERRGDPLCHNGTKMWITKRGPQADTMVSMPRTDTHAGPGGHHRLSDEKGFKGFSARRQKLDKLGIARSVPATGVRECEVAG